MEKICELTFFVLESLISGVFYIRVLQSKYNKNIQCFILCCINIGFLFTDITIFRYLIVFIVEFCYVIFLFKDDFKRKFTIYILKQSIIIVSLLLSFCIYRNLAADASIFMSKNIANNIVYFYMHLVLLSCLLSVVGIYLRKDKKCDSSWIVILILSIAAAQLFLVLNFVNIEFDAMKSYYLIFFVVAVICSVLSNIGISSIFSVLIQNLSAKKTCDYSENLSNMEFNYYKMALENDKKLKAIRHDISNHIQTVYFLLENGEKNRGLELLKKIKEDYACVNHINYCDNPVVNIILANKKNDAEKNGIETHIKIKDRFDNLSITDFDLSTITCNLIDNAIRGAINSNQTNPKLIIEMLQKNNHLVIKIINSCAINLYIENTDRLETTQADASAHGMGMQMITNIVKKYNGDFVVSAQNGIFIATVVMNIK